MKLRLFLVPAVCVSGLVFSAVSTRSQTVLTFDDLSETGSGSSIASPYQGLIWNNVECNNAVLFTNVLPHLYDGAPTNGLSGDFYGMASPSNVAVFFSGSEIDSLSTGFNFLSAYLTGFWKSNLNVEVQGFNGTNLVYDETKVVSATSPTLLTFDYLDIDRLTFNPLGGQSAFAGGVDGHQFVMDDFMFEFVPEPSSLLLTALGLIPVLAFLRRRRTHPNLRPFSSS